MANVWFCSDLHLGHKNIQKFRAPLVISMEHNTQRILDEWKTNVTKRDIVYCLGDFCFEENLIQTCADLPGTKYLIRGNHDKFMTETYLYIFKEVYGLHRYKEFWLSHAPMHPVELRGKINLHGHVHYSTLTDPRYFNCCPENLWPLFGRALVSLDEIRKHLSI